MLLLNYSEYASNGETIGWLKSTLLNSTVHNLSPALCTQISENIDTSDLLETCLAMIKSACCELSGHVYGRVVFDELEKVRDFLPAPNLMSLIIFFA